MTGAIIPTGVFPLCTRLFAALSAFQRDAADLEHSRFIPYPDRHLYSEGWSILPIVLRWDAVPALLDLERNQRLCPASHSLLAGEPQVRMGGFSRLLPGARVFRHADRPLRGVLRFHLCLGGGGGSVLEAAGTTIALRPGEGFVFDHSMPHAAHNGGSVPRDALIVDFAVTEGEREALLRLRGGVNLGPTSEASATPCPRPVAAPSPASDD